MTQIARGRTDQFGNFVAVLELSTVDLNYRPWILQQAFRRCLHDARLAGTGGPEEQEVPDRPPGSTHSGEMHLIDVHDLLYRVVLADYEPVQTAFQALRFAARFRRIQRDVRFHHVGPLSQALHPFPSNLNASS